MLELPVTVVLIIGGYQFYFWAQRQRFFPATFLETRWDGWIRFDPRWVWVYSGLYYPMILLAALSVPDWRAFALTVGGYLALLFAQMVPFIFWPVEIPASWRNRPKGVHPRSERFLEIVWSYDKLRNSCPSMHVSVAMMTDLVIGRAWPAAGAVGVMFPILIAVSALKTKQHYVVDVVPGAILGGAVFYLWNWMVT